MKYNRAQPGGAGSPFGGGLSNPEQFFAKRRFTIGHGAIYGADKALQRSMNKPVPASTGNWSETPPIVKKLINPQYQEIQVAPPVPAETAIVPEPLQSEPAPEPAKLPGQPEAEAGPRAELVTVPDNPVPVQQPAAVVPPRGDTQQLTFINEIQAAQNAVLAALDSAPPTASSIEQELIRNHADISDVVDLNGWLKYEDLDTRIPEDYRRAA